jgi:hypothetical protein
MARQDNGNGYMNDQRIMVTDTSMVRKDNGNGCMNYQRIVVTDTPMTRGPRVIDVSSIL